MARIATGTSASSTTDFNEYGTLFKLVRGDSLGEVQFTLKDSSKAAEGTTLDSTNSDTWAPVDVTNATMLLKIREENGVTIKTTIPVYASGLATEGNVFFHWTAEALDTAGMFTGEIEISYTDGRVMTVYKELRFQIREDY